MDIPSSPPSLPSDDLPSSPSLPQDATAYGKRPYPVEYDSLSSDPIFSEDASESDSQTGAKRKRLYKGPWWGDGTPVPRRENKPAKVNDSGVWLGSEASDDGMGLSQSQSKNRGQASVPHTVTTFRSPLSARKRRPRAPSRPRATALPTAETLATRIIMNCVEVGDECVDLSDMNLTNLLPEAARLLHQLILSRDMDKTGHRVYVPLTPSLRVFLSKNSLSELPYELGTLTNITVLSLRNNALTELPEWIGNLRRLIELNIAGNQIRILPWGLLQILQSQQGRDLRLLVRPNPLLSPVGPTCDLSSSKRSVRSSALIEDAQRHRPDHCEKEDGIFRTMVGRITETFIRRKQMGTSASNDPIYAASSDMTYYDVDGMPVRSPYGTAAFLHDKTPSHAILGRPSPVPGPETHSPSLFEAALRSCRNSPYLDQLPSMLPIDAPQRVEAAVHRLVSIKGQALPQCSVCQGRFVLKRADWVEFWHVGEYGSGSVTQSSFLPFARCACSWGCAKVVQDEHERKADMDVNVNVDVEMTL